MSSSSTKQKSPTIRHKQRAGAGGSSNLIPAAIATSVVLVAVMLVFVPGSTPVGERALGSDSKPNKPETDADLRKQLITWVKKNGATVNVRLGIGERGRGVFIGKKPAEHGDLLYEVPETVWMSVATVKAHSKFATVLADDNFRAIVKNTGKRYEHNVLALALLYERNIQKSHWRPYIRTLPKLNLSDVGPTCLLWSNSMVDELHSDYTKQDWFKTRQWRNSYYFKFADYLEKNHQDIWTIMNATVDEYTHMFFQVISRAFNCQMPTAEGHDYVESLYHNSAEPQSCLIPFCDMVNHEHSITNQNTMTMTMPAKKAFYTAMAPAGGIKKGKEVLQSYAGEPSKIESTLHYLRSYGMVNSDLANTKGDYIIFNMSHSSFEETILSPVEGSAKVQKKFMNKLVSLLRLDNKEAGVKEATTIIQEAVKKEQRALPTTLAEDKALISNFTNIPYWQQTAIKFRVRFKNILDKLAASPELETTESPDFPGSQWSPDIENNHWLKKNAMIVVSINL